MGLEPPKAAAHRLAQPPFPPNLAHLLSPFALFTGARCRHGRRCSSPIAVVSFIHGVRAIDLAYKTPTPRAVDKP